MVRITPIALILLCCGPALAQDNSWPRWRGPLGNDHSPDKGLLKKWPDDGPERLWLFEDAGNGYSGFSVVDGHLYTLGTRDGNACALCLDFKTGKEVWCTDLGNRLRNGWGDGPRCTPTVDGDHLYMTTGPGDVVCLKRKDGKKVWSRSMTEFGGKVPIWGYSESLTVDGNKVICTPGEGADGALVALDKKNGKKIWQSEGFVGKAEYSSVVKATIQGKEQYVRLLQKKVGGVDAATGTPLWSVDWPGKTAVCPTPIVKGNRVYVTSGYGVGCMMVEVKDDGAEIVWQNKVMRNHHGGVVLVGDYLYGHADYAWVCQKWDDGEEVWRDRSLRKGGVHYADGMLYCVEERAGTVALVEASPQGFKEVSRFRLSPQSEIRARRGKIWVHPVVVNGRMLLRDQEYIYCYDVKAKSQDTDK